MGLTTNLKLILTGESALDKQKTLSTWRKEMSGETGISNMQKIDTALGGLQRTVSGLATRTAEAEDKIEEIEAAIEGESPDQTLIREEIDELKDRADVIEEDISDIALNINGLSARIGTAQSAAQTANANASSALALAGAMRSDIQAVSGNAATALSRAANAETDALYAKDTALTAKNDASAAKTAATSASTDAASAKTSAQGAATSAATANTNALTALTETRSLSATATLAKTSADAAATDAASAASDAAAAKTAATSQKDLSNNSNLVGVLQPENGGTGRGSLDYVRQQIFQDLIVEKEVRVTTTLSYHANTVVRLGITSDLSTYTCFTVWYESFSSTGNNVIVSAPVVYTASECYVCIFNPTSSSQSLDGVLHFMFMPNECIQFDDGEG